MEPNIETLVIKCISAEYQVLRRLRRLKIIVGSKYVDVTPPANLTFNSLDLEKPYSPPAETVGATTLSSGDKPASLTSHSDNVWSGDNKRCSEASQDTRQGS